METGELLVLYRECDEDRSSEAALGDGGAQRPALQVSELKKTGAHSARARTHGQNQLVLYRRPFLIYDFATDPSKFPYIGEKFSVFLSVRSNSWPTWK